MGTCTIRDKNFLYREAMEAICLLQCRWGSRDEAPVQRWPFCKGRRALLSLWDSLQKCSLGLLALLTSMVFIVLWPMTLKLLMLISDCSPMNHALKLRFSLPPPSLDPFSAISSISRIVSCDQQESGLLLRRTMLHAWRHFIYWRFLLEDFVLDSAKCWRTWGALT